MGNKLGGNKSNSKSKEDKKREQEEKKLQKKEQKARKKSSSKKTRNKKLARGGFQNSGSEFDTDLDSSHFTGADSESGVYHSAENLSTSPYLDSCTKSERGTSGLWPASSSGGGAASRHPQVLSSRDFRDGFSLEACIPPEIARPTTLYTDTTTNSGGSSGGGGGGGGSISGGSNTMSYRCHNNSSGSLKSKRSNSVKSHGPSSSSLHHTPTSSRYHHQHHHHYHHHHHHYHDDVMSGSTSSSQKSGQTGTGGYCTPLLSTPVFGRAERSVSPHYVPSRGRVHEPDIDSMDIVPLSYSPFDPETKVFTTYNPTIIHKDNQGQLHQHSYFHQPVIDYRNLPKPTSPHPQRRAFSPKMTTAPFRIISSDDSSSSPTTPIPQRKAVALLSDLFRAAKKKKQNGLSDDDEKPSFLQRLEKKSKEESKQNDDAKSSSASNKSPIWKTWERSNKRKSSSRESKLSIFGTARKTEKSKSRKDEQQDSKGVKKDRSSDSTLQDFKVDGENETAKPTPTTRKTTKSSTSSFENGLNSKGTSDYDFTAEKNRNSSPPVAKSAAFCIMRLEELERNIEKTIKEKFPDAESFLSARKNPPIKETRGSKSLPTTPSLRKKLYVARDLDLSSADESAGAGASGGSPELSKLSSRLDELKGVTRYYDETFEESSSPAKSPVILRRFGARTRHASISPKIQRAKTAAIYNSPSEMERLTECRQNENDDLLKSTNNSNKNNGKPYNKVNGTSSQLSSSPKGPKSQITSSKQNAQQSFSSYSTKDSFSSIEPAEKAIIKARLKSYSRPLIRQKRIEETNTEEPITVKDSSSGRGQKEEEMVIVSTASAVFGSVSPKLRRHHNKTKQENGKPGITEKDSNDNEDKELNKRHGDLSALNPGQKAREVSPKDQTKTKRRSGSLDSLMDSLRGSTNQNIRTFRQDDPEEKDKQRGVENRGQKKVGGADSKKSPDKSPTLTGSAVSVRSRVRSINKSLSEESAAVHAHYGRGRGASWERDSMASNPSSPSGQSFYFGSHYSRSPDSRFSPGDGRGERTSRNNSISSSGMGVSPTCARKHSADHVVFGTAVALPCRVYSSPSSTEGSKSRVTSPSPPRGRGGRSPLSPPRPLPHPSSTHIHREPVNQMEKNAKNSDCQQKKNLDSYDAEAEEEKRKRNVVSSDQTSKRSDGNTPAQLGTSRSKADEVGGSGSGGSGGSGSGGRGGSSGSRRNGQEGKGVARCVRDDVRLPVPGKEFIALHLNGGRKERGDHLQLRRIFSDKRKDSDTGGKRAAASTTTISTTITTTSTNVVKPSDDFSDVGKQGVDKDRRSPHRSVTPRGCGDGSDGNSGANNDGVNVSGGGAEGDYDNLIPRSDIHESNICFVDTNSSTGRTCTDGKAKTPTLRALGSHDPPTRQYNQEQSCRGSRAQQQHQHQQQHKYQSQQQHHHHQQQQQQYNSQQQKVNGSPKPAGGIYCSSRLQDEQPIVVLKQKPISKIISDMINVSKQKQQQQQQQTPVQEQELQPTPPSLPPTQQQQQQQQTSQRQHQVKSSHNNQQQQLSHGDAFVAKEAITMVTSHSSTPIDIKERDSHDLDSALIHAWTSEDDMEKFSPEESRQEQHHQAKCSHPGVKKREERGASSDETGGSDNMDNFMHVMKDSLEKSSATASVFREKRKQRVVEAGTGFQMGESIERRAPPPPSPNTLDKLMAEFAEEDEDEDEDEYQERITRDADSRQVNLALTRQTEMKEFTEKVMDRLSDLLGSQSGTDLGVVEDDEVFIDDRKKEPLLEGAPYRVVTKDEEEGEVKVNDEEEEDEDDDNNANDCCPFLDRDEPLQPGFMLAASTTDPFAADRLKPSRFSTSSSLSTSSSSSSSSSGLFAPPAPATSSKRDYNAELEGMPASSSLKPDFFVFPETSMPVETAKDEEEGQESVYWSRAAHTRSYHSDDDVARGGGIPEYYDDTPLWHKSQKPPGQISAKMASIRRRERRERWLKKRRRNKTDLLSTCSSEVGSERSRDHSRLSLDNFEEDEEVARLSSQRGAMGSGILTSPKYTKPIMPFLMDRGQTQTPPPPPPPPPVLETFTSRKVTTESSVPYHYTDKERTSKRSSCSPKNTASGGGSVSRYELENSRTGRGREKYSDEERDNDGSNDNNNERRSSEQRREGMKIPGLEETFDELLSVQQILDGLQERTHASADDALHSRDSRSEPRIKCMPLTAENIKSMKEQYKDSNNSGRLSRLSNTNRTESDLDIYSEYRDDASTDSNLYADDEDDDDGNDNDPYTTADDDLSDGNILDDDTIDNVVVSCTFYNSNAFPQQQSVSYEANYDDGRQNVPGSSAATTSTTTSLEANRLSTPISSVRNSTEEELLRDWRAGTNIITNSNLRQDPADTGFLMNRSFTATTSSTIPALQQQPPQPQPQPQPQPPSAAAAAAGAASGDNSSSQQLPTIYMRSNSAPGAYTGRHLSVSRDAAMAAINSDEEFWAGRATFERSYQQLEVAAGEVSSTFQNAREQMIDIQHHLQALRRQMEGLQEDLTSTSYTLTPDFSANDSK